MVNTIVAEVRHAREALAQRFNYDLLGCDPGCQRTTGGGRRWFGFRTWPSIVASTGRAEWRHSAGIVQGQICLSGFVGEYGRWPKVPFYPKSWGVAPGYGESRPSAKRTCSGGRCPRLHGVARAQDTRFNCGDGRASVRQVNDGLICPSVKATMGECLSTWMVPPIRGGVNSRRSFAMVTSDFVEIASYANAVEAEHVRALLEENGVSAFVDGAAANTAL